MQYNRERNLHNNQPFRRNISSHYNLVMSFSPPVTCKYVSALQTYTIFTLSRLGKELKPMFYKHIPYLPYEDWEKN